MSRPPRMIEIRVSKLAIARGGRVLAGPLDFALVGGQALAVTGENGAGKSTLLRTLAGLLPPAEGTILVTGATAADGEPARRISDVAHYLGHRNAMKAALTVEANLRFWRNSLGLGRLGLRDTEGGGANNGVSPLDALVAVGLPGIEDTPYGFLSAGQQRRAAIARLLVAPRPAWILDEPTAALDAASQALFARLLARHLASGGIVLAATHQPLGIPAAELRLERRAPYDLDALADADLASAEGWQ